MSDSEIKLFYAQSSEVKNRILAPDEHLRAIDTGAYYVAGPDGKPQAVLTATTSAQGVAISAPSGAAVPLDPRQGVLIVGDSRSQFGTYPENSTYFVPAAISDTQWLRIAPLGFGPAELEYGATRVMQYRGTDKSVRWPDKFGGYGPWTPVKQGVVQVESGTPGAWMKILFRSVALQPDIDRNVNIQIQYTAYAIEQYLTPTHRAVRALRLSAKFCGASGGALEEFAELADPGGWYAQQASGCGYFTFRTGTNNVTVERSLDWMTGYAKTVLDALLKLGLRGVVIGETARWGTAVGIPMSANQLSLIVQYNKWLQSYCTAQSDSLRYVDTWSLTVDPAYTDGRPASGMLSDAVHDAETGSAVLLTQPIVDALKSLGVSEQPGKQHGDPSNLFLGGWMTGTGGTKGAGVSGTVPDRWEVVRKNGADITAAASVEAMTHKRGNWLRADVAATADGQTLSLNTTYANRQAITSLGKVVGDPITLECDFSIEITSGSLKIPSAIYVLFWSAGSSLIWRTQARIAAPGLHKIVTPTIAIPDATTLIQVYCEVTPAASSSVTVKLGDVFIK